MNPLDEYARTTAEQLTSAIRVLQADDLTPLDDHEKPAALSLTQHWPASDSLVLDSDDLSENELALADDYLCSSNDDDTPAPLCPTQAENSAALLTDIADLPDDYLSSFDDDDKSAMSYLAQEESNAILAREFVDLPELDAFDQLVFGIDELPSSDESEFLSSAQSEPSNDSNPDGLIALLAPEFLPMIWQLDGLLQRIAEADPRAVQDYIDVCRRLGEAADLVEADALRTTFLFIAVEMREYALGNFDDNGAQFRQQLAQVQHCLADWFSGSNCENAAMQLEIGLNSALWHQGDFAQQVPNLATQLLQLATRTFSTAPVPAELHRTDFILAVPDDVQPQLFEAFLQEAPQHIETMQALLSQLQKQGIDLAVQHELLRAVHTFKGASATVGINTITQLCHQLETLLDRALEQQIELTTATLLLCSECTDCLADMIESLNHRSAPPDNAFTLARQLLALTEGVAIEAITVVDEEPEQQANALSETSLATSQDESNVATQTAVRVSLKSIDELLRSGGELATLTGHADDHYRQLMLVSQSLDQLSISLQQRMIELEHMADISATPFLNKKNDSHGEVMGGFDPLEMDQYNELHGHLRGLAESVSDVNELSLGLTDELALFRTWSVQQQQSNRQLQNKMLAMRMAPVRTLLPRLERCVRQAARLTDKTVKLDYEGMDTLVDIDILERIADPLVHLLRNAVDHGIEDSATRQSSNKAANGRILLQCKREANFLVIHCQDDGCGLDYERIRATAINRGLLKADSACSEAELSQLIFQPGFSTRDEVTTTSGRGFGMDIVQTVVNQLNGQLQINSVRGKGCNTSLRLPLTMISLHVLLTRCDGQLYALPSNLMHNIVVAEPKEFMQQGQQQCYRHFDRVLRVTRLQGSSNISSPSENVEQHLQPGLVYRDRYGVEHLILVDEVLACREVVLKRFGKYLHGAQGSLGMAQMADGQLVCVLDPAALVASPSTAAISAIRPQSMTTPMQSSLTQQTKVLVVEDSLSTRRALQQMIGDAGYEVRTAIDGVEALDTIKQWQPDAVLTDLEMPRLNGLELTAQLRNGVHHLIPVIMLTSRSTQKHREQAKRLGVQAYLTKPFSDTDILMQLETVLERRA